AELYLYDVAADEHHALRTGEGSASRVRWTPDGRLSFLTRAADGDARPSLYVMDIATREMERALAFGASIGVYDWSPSGDRIAFVAQAPADAAEPVLPYRPDIYEEDVADRPLWIADAFSDAAPRKIDLPGTVYDVAWSPAGDRIAAALAPTPHVDD